MSKENANNLVVAVFHKAGKEPHLRDDIMLAKLFNEASSTSPNVFGDFAWHPQYKDSKLLSRTLSNLDIGGDIYHEAASGMNFRLSTRVLEDYGKKVYDGLSPKARKAVDTLANKIVVTFS